MKTNSDMLRNSRTPTLLLVGLVVVIMIITYNYWSLLEKNALLRDNLIVSEEKLADLVEKKANLEKQNTLSQDRIKYFEDKMRANMQAMQKKDSEIDELNTKLKAKSQDSEKSMLEINELKEKLNICTADKAAKVIELERKLDLSQTENKDLKQNFTLIETKLNQQISSKVVEKPDCNSTVTEALATFRAALAQKVNFAFDKNSANKMLSLFLDAPALGTTLEVAKIEDKRDVKEGLNASLTSTNTAFHASLITQPIQKLNESTNSIGDICKLEKDQGTCSKDTERYYFDKMSGLCLIFVYHGCEGNANNFETIEKCKETCIKTSTISESKSSKQVFPLPFNEHVAAMSKSVVPGVSSVPRLASTTQADVRV